MGADAARVPRLFPDATIVVLATGPSLTAEDVGWCRGKAPVVAVNDAYRLAPWADVLYAADAKWWRQHQGVPTFRGLRYSLHPDSRKILEVAVLEHTGDTGIEREPTGLRRGQNSGYQAVNVAVHLGARRILLLGFDVSRWPDQSSHFFGDHPRALQVDSPYESFRRHFATMVKPLQALGVSVVNCSRRTALTCFPCQPLREALP